THNDSPNGDLVADPPGMSAVASCSSGSTWHAAAGGGNTALRPRVPAFVTRSESTNPHCDELDGRGGKAGEHGERDPGSRQMEPAPACPYLFNSVGCLALRKPPKR